MDQSPSDCPCVRPAAREPRWPWWLVTASFVAIGCVFFLARGPRIADVAGESQHLVRGARWAFDLSNWDVRRGNPVVHVRLDESSAGSHSKWRLDYGADGGRTIAADLESPEIDLGGVQPGRFSAEVLSCRSERALNGELVVAGDNDEAASERRNLGEWMSALSWGLGACGLVASVRARPRTLRSA